MFRPRCPTSAAFGRRRPTGTAVRGRGGGGPASAALAQDESTTEEPELPGGRRGGGEQEQGGKSCAAAADSPCNQFSRPSARIRTEEGGRAGPDIHLLGQARPRITAQMDRSGGGPKQKHGASICPAGNRRFLAYEHRFAKLIKICVNLVSHPTHSSPPTSQRTLQVKIHIIRKTRR